MGSSTSKAEYGALRVEERRPEHQLALDTPRTPALPAHLSSRIAVLRREAGLSVPETLTEHDWHLAFARFTIGITKRHGGTYRIEESVYGAALLIPQLARTVGWDHTFIALSFRVWIFLALNICLQAYLLFLIALEEQVWDKFSGEMHLCDYGAHIGLPGPGDTDITPPRLYGWAAIAGHQFVKDAFKAVFPDRAEDIDRVVDVGEYGVESYFCRLACCFIFMCSCMQEMNRIVSLVGFLNHIPRANQPWIVPKDLSEGGELMVGNLDQVHIRLAGMPLFWKLLNMMVIVAPKFVLWCMTARLGVTFLMETNDINDIIVNAVALTFILGIDELLASELMNKNYMEMVQAANDYELFDEHTSCVGDITKLSDEEILAAYLQEQHSWANWTFRKCLDLVPWAFLATCGLVYLFVNLYYWEHCVYDKSEGQWVSKSMYTPKSIKFSLWNTLLPWIGVPEEATPYWVGHADTEV